MVLGAAVTEVHCNHFVPHVVDERNHLVTEQLIRMPLKILNDSLGGGGGGGGVVSAAKYNAFSGLDSSVTVDNV